MKRFNKIMDKTRVYIPEELPKMDGSNINASEHSIKQESHKSDK